MTVLDWSRCAAVERSPEKVSGAWVFCGTRVPVKALFENLEEVPRSMIFSPGFQEFADTRS